MCNEVVKELNDMSIKDLYRDDIQQLFSKVSANQLDILEVQKALSDDEWQDFSVRYDSWYTEIWAIKNYSRLIQSM